MLAFIRKTIPFHRARRQRTPFPYGSLSNHMLRDLGFESRQVGEIMAFIAGDPKAGQGAYGSDAELFECVRIPAGPAANSNEPGADETDDEEPEKPARPDRSERTKSERTKGLAATDSGRPVLALVFRHDPAHATVR